MNAFANKGAPAGRIALVFLSALLLGVGVGLGVGFAQTEEPTTVIEVATHPELGDILVGLDGFTLYTFANDTEDSLACTGGCAVNFPPLLLDGELMVPEGIEGIFDTIMRGPDEDAGLENAVAQVTYNGQPLYYWSRDTIAGDATGNGIGDLWFVARP